ncbi:MAG TPA: HlyD family efflux transporter periplasmic adaptor subunit [Kofleriaceae bacterium]|nr:HlyD family efflux transporter periplasmic adaptor subunit [Kofleriaceae bacterium]
MFGECDEVVRVGAPPIMAVADVVLLADADPAARVWVRSVVAGRFVLDEASSGAAALERIAAGNVRLLIVGKRLTDMTGEVLVARVAQSATGDRRDPIVFLLADSHGECAEVADPLRVFYRLVRGMQTERVRELLQQAAAIHPALPPREVDPALTAAVAAHVSRVGATTGPEQAAAAIVESVRALVDADRVQCLFCDDATGTVWSGLDEDSRDADASEGLTGFAIRTAAGIHIPRAAADPMYRREIDDRDGDGGERLAIQPVVGPDGHVHAVVVAARGPRRPMFGDDEIARLEAFAVAVAPYLMQLELRIEADAIIGDRLDRGPSDVFRLEAIMAMVRRGSRGDVVRVHPRWVSAAYWVILAALVSAVAFAALAQVHQYTDGPAIIRYTGRSNVVAFEAGTISALEVTHGQHVEAGQVLVRLHDVEQAGRLRGLETEFERKLVAYLQSPASPTVREELAQIVSERESAMAGVESRVIRAPRAGTVKEVMVHNGQHVDPGATVLSIGDDGAAEGLSVLAFLPGRERPRLHVRQRLHLTLPGYRGVRIDSTVRAISSEVLDASDARARYLPDRLGDSLPVTGTVVVVEARLDTAEFESDGRRFQLHEGMGGVAEVQLGTRSVLEALIPGLP